MRTYSTLIVLLCLGPVARAEGGVCPAILGKLWDKVQQVRLLDLAMIPQGKMKKEIFATAKSKSLVRVAVKDLTNIHPMSAPPSEKMRRRTEELKGQRQEILAAGALTVEKQNELIPSQTPMRVAKDKSGRYIIFDGNGRFKSIEAVFAGNPNLLIEVEYYESPSREARNLLEEVLGMRRRLVH